MSRHACLEQVEVSITILTGLALKGGSYGTARPRVAAIRPIGRQLSAGASASIWVGPANPVLAEPARNAQGDSVSGR